MVDFPTEFDHPGSPDLNLLTSEERFNGRKHPGNCSSNLINAKPRKRRTAGPSDEKEFDAELHQAFHEPALDFTEPDPLPETPATRKYDKRVREGFLRSRDFHLDKDLQQAFRRRSGYETPKEGEEKASFEILDYCRDEDSSLTTTPTSPKEPRKKKRKSAHKGSAHKIGSRSGCKSSDNNELKSELSLLSEMISPSTEMTSPKILQKTSTEFGSTQPAASMPDYSPMISTPMTPMISTSIESTPIISTPPAPKNLSPADFSTEASPKGSLNNSIFSLAKTPLLPKKKYNRDSFTSPPPSKRRENPPSLIRSNRSEKRRKRLPVVVIPFETLF